MCLFIVYRQLINAAAYPVVKAIAANVLASKLGADIGLKMFLRDGKNPNAPLGKSNYVELVQSIALWNMRLEKTFEYDKKLFSFDFIKDTYTLFFIMYNVYNVFACMLM